MDNDYLFFLIISSAPMVLPLLVLTLALLILRRSRMKRRNRMINAENYATGGSTDSWEAAQGPSTLSDLPVPHSFENNFERSGRPADD